jgi:hypothetical protein
MERVVKTGAARLDARLVRGCGFVPPLGALEAALRASLRAARSGVPRFTGPMTCTWWCRGDYGLRGLKPGEVASQISDHEQR